MYRAYRTTAILVVAASMLWGFLAQPVQAGNPTTQVVGRGPKLLRQPLSWFTAHRRARRAGFCCHPSATLTAAAATSGSGMISHSGRTHTITEVQWRGGYSPARLGGPVVDFTLAIYPSIPAGTEPDVAHPPLVHYQVGGNAGETPVDVLGDVQTYAYRDSLPAPFEAVAGKKY